MKEIAMEKQNESKRCRESTILRWHVKYLL